MCTYVVRQLIKYRDCNNSLAFVNIAMRVLSGLAQAMAVPCVAGLEIHAASEKSLADVIAKCYAFFPGDIEVGPVEVILHPTTGASPFLFIEATTPWRFQRYVRLGLLERGLTVTAINPAESDIHIYGVGPMEHLLGVEAEIDRITERKGSVRLRFSHYSFWDSPPPSGSAA